MSSKRKLTLRIDASLVEKAKKEAQKRGLSVSEMVSRYFLDLRRESTNQELIDREIETKEDGRPGRDRPLPDAVRRLVGAGKSPRDEATREQDSEAISEKEAYFQYLERKHE